MSKHARYRVMANSNNVLVIKDMGPWDNHLTVTNDAEWVVMDLQHKYLFHILGNGLAKKRLFCIDSEGRMDELVLLDSGGYYKFVAFKAL